MEWELRYIASLLQMSATNGGRKTILHSAQTLTIQMLPGTLLSGILLSVFIAFISHLFLDWFNLNSIFGCDQECAITSMYAQNSCCPIEPWFPMARAVAWEGGESTLLVIKHWRWRLWKTSSRRFPDRLRALETCGEQLLSKWTGNRVVDCEECYGYASCLWRVSCWN